MGHLITSTLLITRASASVAGPIIEGALGTIGTYSYAGKVTAETAQHLDTINIVDLPYEIDSPHALLYASNEISFARDEDGQIDLDFDGVPDENTIDIFERI